MRPFLGRLVPVLLKNMVYDEYDEEVRPWDMIPISSPIFTYT